MFRIAVHVSVERSLPLSFQMREDDMFLFLVTMLIEHIQDYSKSSSKIREARISNYALKLGPKRISFVSKTCVDGFALIFA